MNDFIKQQQELAREFYEDELCCLSADCEKQRQTVGAYNALIITIIQNTGEELTRLAEGDKMHKDKYHNSNYYSYPNYCRDMNICNAAIDTLKKHITDVTGVENLLDDNQ